MHLQPANAGWIEVVCGSMFSGKTEELIRRLKRALIAQQHVQVFKPRIDERYDKTAIASHAGRRLDAVAVRDVSEIRANLASDVQVVGIDEAQFFGEGLRELCEELADGGARVVVAGLDQDYLGEPFGVMPMLMAVAEYVTKVHAICARCGNPANRSHRMRGGDSKERVQVGAAEAYEALCRPCFADARRIAQDEALQEQLPLGASDDE